MTLAAVTLYLLVGWNVGDGSYAGAATFQSLADCEAFVSRPAIVEQYVTSGCRLVDLREPGAGNDPNRIFSTEAE